MLAFFWLVAFCYDSVHVVLPISFRVASISLEQSYDCLILRLLQY